MNPIEYDDDERIPSQRTYRQSIRDDDYWRGLCADILKAALIAAIGVLVRELVSTIEGRHPRTLDPYGV